MGDQPLQPGRQPTDQPLQFDRVELPPDQASDTASAPGVVCRGCGAAITTEYFDLAGTPVCEACRGAIERAQDAARGWPRFARAAAFGSVAAIAGAILYYAVIAITNLEIGLVAIVIGFMVGFAVTKGTGGHGSRRYQLLAVIPHLFCGRPGLHAAGGQPDRTQREHTPGLVGARRRHRRGPGAYPATARRAGWRHRCAATASPPTRRSSSPASARWCC